MLALKHLSSKTFLSSSGLHEYIIVCIGNIKSTAFHFPLEELLFFLYNVVFVFDSFKYYQHQ